MPDDVNIVVEVDSATAICANHIAEIENVSNNMGKISEVTDYAVNVAIVAGSIDNVNAVGNNINAVTTVASSDNLSNIDNVSDNIIAVNNVSSNMSDVKTVSNNATTLVTNMPSMVTIAGDLNDDDSNIKTVASNISNINKVAAIDSNVSKVAAIDSNVTTVAGISSDVTTVAGISASVSAVASNTTNINAVNSNKTNIDAVAGNATNINAVNSNKTNINTVANSSSNINTVAGSISNVNSCASNITAINNAVTSAASAAASANTATAQANKAEQQANLARRYAEETHGASDVTVSNLRALPAMNNYEYPQTDEDGLTDLIEAYHSTFDLSKFGNNTSGLTNSNGIISGFSASNYLYSDAFDASQSFEIYEKITIGTLTGVQDIIDTYGTGLEGFIIRLESGTLRVVSSDGTTSTGYSVTSGNTYILKFIYSGSGNLLVYVSSDNGITYTKIADKTITSFSANQIAYLGIRGASTPANPFQGSVDIKYFKILINGVPVFNGNQTGMDIIKVDNYTKTPATTYNYYCFSAVTSVTSLPVKVYANGTGETGSNITTLYYYPERVAFGTQSGTTYTISMYGHNFNITFTTTAISIKDENGNIYTMSRSSSDDYSYTTDLSISADGVVSGFSTTNYITTPTVDYSGASTITIKCAFKYYSVANYTNVFAGQSANYSPRLVLTPNGTVQLYLYDGTTTNTNVIPETYFTAGNWYLIEWTINSSVLSSYKLYEYPTMNLLYTDSHAVVTPLNLNFNTWLNPLYIGRSASTGDLPFSSEIDLNAFKIYVNGDLVYQPCLKIPYTLSKTGSKVVDSYYRDRVNDMYEQFGYANYFTLKNEVKRYTKVGNLTLTDEGKASNFDSGYIGLDSFKLTAPFEIDFGKVTTGSGNIKSDTLLGCASLSALYSTIGDFRVKINDAGKWQIMDNLLSTNVSPAANTDYWIKAGIDSSDHGYLKISTDGVNYTTYTGTTPADTSLPYAWRLGVDETYDYWTGSIENIYNITITSGGKTWYLYENANFTVPQGSTYGYLQKLTRQNVTDTTSTSVTLAKAKGNTDYHYGTLTSLTITANETSDYETNIYFTAGNSISVSLPATLDYIGTTPSFSANERYVMSILNNILVIGEIA